MEEKHDASWSVSYNLSQWDEGVRGYRLVLKIRNVSNGSAAAAPVIKLLTADGVVVPVADRQRLLELGEEMAGTSIPQLQVDRSAPSGGFAGGFSQGFENGRSRAEHARAYERSAEGRQLIAVASAPWLGQSSPLDAQEATVGALMFLAPANVPLPLRLSVRVGDSKFDFVTRATAGSGLHLRMRFGG
jgi:hypothetical protein